MSENKDLHVHMAFAVSRTKEASLSDTSFVSFVIHDEVQFRAWLGQVMANMLDLYRLARDTDIKDEEAVDPSALAIFSNPIFLEANQWIKIQGANADEDIAVRLGSDYEKFVSFINDNHMILHPRVKKIEIDPLIGHVDKRCEVYNGD